MATAHGICSFASDTEPFGVFSPSARVVTSRLESAPLRETGGRRPRPNHNRGTLATRLQLLVLFEIPASFERRRPSGRSERTSQRVLAANPPPHGRFSGDRSPWWPAMNRACLIIEFRFSCASQCSSRRTTRQTCPSLTPARKPHRGRFRLLRPFGRPAHC